VGRCGANIAGGSLADSRSGGNGRTSPAIGGTSRSIFGRPARNVAGSAANVAALAGRRSRVAPGVAPSSMSFTRSSESDARQVESDARQVESDARQVERDAGLSLTPLRPRAWSARSSADVVSFSRLFARLCGPRGPRRRNEGRRCGSERLLRADDLSPRRIERPLRGSVTGSSERAARRRRRRSRTTPP
jgi:hypothetical protein